MKQIVNSNPIGTQNPTPITSTLPDEPSTGNNNNTMIIVAVVIVILIVIGICVYVAIKKRKANGIGTTTN